MKKSTIVLSVITLLLVTTIGAGIFVVMNRKSQPAIKQNTEERAKTFTASEVAAHNTKDNCWTIISDQVYELTEYVNRHPGGSEILRACGTDATTLFTSRQTRDGQYIGTGSPHSSTAQQQLEQLRIGELAK